MRKLQLLLIVVILLFSGCKSDNPVDPNEESINVIMPLQVGNQWTYIDSTFDENDALVYVDSLKLGIIGKTNIKHEGENIDLFHWSWISNEGGIPYGDQRLARNENDGLSFFGKRILDENYVHGKSLEIKYPAAVGDTWEVESFLYSSEDSSFSTGNSMFVTCKSINEKFLTSLGEMECYVYLFQKSINNEEDSFSLYFNKNLGYVGGVSVVNDTGKFKRTLKSFTSNGLFKAGDSKDHFEPNVKMNKNYRSAFGIK